VIDGADESVEYGDRPSPLVDEVQVTEDLVQFLDEEGQVIAESPQVWEIADRPEPEDFDAVEPGAVVLDRDEGSIAAMDIADEDHPLHGLRLKDDFITFASLNGIELSDDATTIKAIRAEIEAEIDRRQTTGAEAEQASDTDETTAEQTEENAPESVEQTDAVADELAAED
jgi:hypothetical protein